MTLLKEYHILKSSSIYSNPCKAATSKVTTYKFFQQVPPMKFSNTLTQCCNICLKNLFRQHKTCSFTAKKRVSYKGNINRRLNNSNTQANITNDNIHNRIAKFTEVINNEKVCRIPLRYLCDLGKINYPVKTNTKITCSLEQK